MRKKNIYLCCGLIALIIASLVSYELLQEPLQLYLYGSTTELVYEIAFGDDHQDRSSIVKQTCDTIERRLSISGLLRGSYSVETAGDATIRVRLKMLSRERLDELRKEIEAPGMLLTFHLVASCETMERYRGRNAPTGYIWNKIVREQDGEKTSEKLLLLERASFVVDDISSASAELDYDGIHSAVKICFGPSATARFARLTSDNVGSRLAIVLDVDREGGTIFSAPVIHGAIVGGEPRITGNFSQEEAEDLVRVILSGKLPASIFLLSRSGVSD